MKQGEDSRIWLFSFADLAFLLLIAFTQTSTVGKKPVNIGEMTVPKVVKTKQVSPIEQGFQSYQIRVLKPTIPETNPFQIVYVEGTHETVDKTLLSAQDLSNKITQLKLDGNQRPILVPDIYSLSKDTLMAMSIIESAYEDANRITIQHSNSLK
jgi:hypothetical protein